ncbi:TPA: hypothetical protein DEW47_00465 [Patescibacteria group bacterium]|nr:MAG: hypothetical protein UT71_C0026G0005 [Parcubacteria group bacterium GW2011_GWF2_40_10]KKR47135.1 MAG: hypothetical protein UT83_C0013G0013 [Parcubacteria group bacterium GW2011_GWA2_40_143]KKR59719.1 MAG: hypothetical protein UT97_C0012G0007 [Parcubacteria group bacterium GW2011_GWC2_40_31]KKR75781.1 MAG: hypothetical protein UU20_C0043G0002 [Parcubacteria group bacterium GW2011_GWE2_40_8]KKR80350.1 MAG: hypothetical protein UU28_C0042G0008 [Parcubacteria group bacterium GW2011_GWD2_40_
MLALSSSAVNFVDKIKVYILNPIIGFMFAVAIVVFIYGIVEYMLGGDNEDRRKDGAKHMTWGVIGIFVMISVFGIMNVIIDFWASV